MNVPIFLKKVAARLVQYTLFKRLMVIAIRVVVPGQRVGVSLVVLDEQERVLLLHHVFHPEIPWGLPGGWLGRGEGPKQAALRELKEETGLTAVIESIIHAGHEESPKHIGLAYLAYADSNDPITLSNEIIEAKWCQPDQLPTPFYTFSYDAIHNGLQMHHAIHQQEAVFR